MVKKSKLADDNNRLKEQLRKLGLMLKDIEGDGNCLFRAISDQLRGSPDSHLEIRESICNHIRDHPELYAIFLEEKLDEYVNRMSKRGVYGGNLELVACCRVFQVSIAVHQDGQDIWQICDDNGESKDLLHIAYHSWEHYSSIRNINGPFTGPPQIAFKKTVAKPITKLESQILNQIGFSIDKLDYIRSLLQKYRGDPTKVLDQLYEELEDQDHENNQSQLEELFSIPEISISAPAEKVIESQKKKKLTKAQKKDLKRKEKREKVKAKASKNNQSVDEVVKEIKLLKI